MQQQRHRMEAVPVALWRLSSGVGMLAFLPAMGQQNHMKTATVQLCNMTMYRDLLSRKQASKRAATVQVQDLQTTTDGTR